MKDIVSGLLSGKKRVILAVALGIVALIVAIYLALCIYVGATRTILPGVRIDDELLGGLTQQEAQQHIRDWTAQRFNNVTYTLTCDGSSVQLDERVAWIDPEEVAQRAYAVGRREPFLKRGAVILRQLLGGQSQMDWVPQLSEEGLRMLNSALNEIDRKERVPVVETVWSVSDTELTITRGTSGRTVDAVQAKQLLEQALLQEGNPVIELALITEQPAPLDMQKLHDAICVRPENAYYDLNSRSVIPHVVGIEFDVPQAQAQFEQLAEGETGHIKFILTTPELTKERLSTIIFSKVLGECTSNVAGNQNRLNNVQVATTAINDTVIMPGEVFSYNDALGPRTRKNGYLPAPAYIGGKTVNDVGGGICQDSSTLYLATLLANLEIVERVNHMYTVGYVPDGLDATVVYNAIDFKFRNNTEYPIRISAVLSGRTLTIKLLGTKMDNTTVKMETKVLSTKPYEVIYKADSSVTIGETVVETTPYTGKKVEAYRCVYDGDGTLISRKLESTNTYRSRNKVILYHPADAERLGIGGSQPTVQPITPPDDPEVPPIDPGTQPPDPEVPDEPTPEPEPEPKPEPEPVPEGGETPQPQE